jgi:hypothetical protein
MLANGNFSGGGPAPSTAVTPSGGALGGSGMTSVVNLNNGAVHGELHEHPPGLRHGHHHKFPAGPVRALTTNSGWPLSR